MLVIEWWDEEAEDSGGHWVGVTHGGTVRCLSRGDRSLAAPRDPHVSAGAVVASILRVHAVWCVVMPPPPSPGVAPAAPAAPVPPRWGLRQCASVARGPRTPWRVWAAPQGVGHFSRALTQLCCHWAAVP